MAGPDLLLESSAVWERYKFIVIGGVALLILALVAPSFIATANAVRPRQPARN